MSNLKIPNNKTRIMEKGISIIIPNLNSPVIDKTLNSILDQLGSENIEIIIIGKDDLNLIKPHRKVKFISTEKKKSPSEARNIGINEAKFNNLIFIDADCIPKKKYFENLINNPHEIVTGAIDFKTNNFWTTCDNFIHFYGIGKSKKAEEMPLIGTIQLKIPKHYVQNVGCFNEKLVTGEDQDLAIKLKKAGCRFYFEPNAIISHYPNRKSFISILRHSMDWAKNGIKVRLKHKDFLKIPKIFGNKYALLLFSPFIALFVTLKIYSHLPNLKYLYFTPFVYLSKLFWFFGAYRGLKK